MGSEQLKKTQEGFNIMANVYANLFTLPLRIHDKYMQTIDKMVQNIILIPKINLKKIEELHERLKNIEKSDFEYKWLQSISIPFWKELTERYEKGHNKEVNQFLIKLFRNKKDIDSFKDWLKNQPAYEERKEIINDCLQAHLEKKFTLSIPTLLTQCDGIIINKVIEKAKYVGKSAKFVNMKQVAKEGKVPMNKYFSQHIIHMYDTKRLGILHGKDINYYKDGEELSVKAIWTLFEIIHFASKIK